MNLKWYFSLVLLLVNVSISLYAHTIYDLSRARHFNTPQNGPFFIQMGSFHSVNLAKQLQAKLTKYTDYPVQIQSIEHEQRHLVKVGPLYSVAAVHAVARQLESWSISSDQQLERNHGVPVLNKRTHLISPTVLMAGSPRLLPKDRWYASIDLGLMQTNSSKNIMTVANGSDFPPPENVDQYSVTNSHPTLLDIQLGYRWARDEPWIPTYAIALRYEHVFTKNIEGVVTEYSNPEFSNYSYRWGVGADVIALYSKFDLVRYRCFMPYIDLGLGLSSNHSRTYNETAVPDVTPRISPDYASKSSTQFTYNFGAGIDYLLTENIWISIGYDYQFFGNFSSGFGQGANWNGEQLKLGRLNSNIGLIGITYLLGE